MKAILRLCWGGAGVLAYDTVTQQLVNQVSQHFGSAGQSSQSYMKLNKNASLYRTTDPLSTKAGGTAKIAT